MDMKRLKNNMWTLLTESPEKRTEVNDTDTVQAPFLFLQAFTGFETLVSGHCSHLVGRVDMQPVYILYLCASVLIMLF